MVPSSARRRLREPAAGEWDFPRSATGVAHLVAYAAAHGLTAGRALAGTGLSPDDLRKAGLEVTAAQELGVVRTLQRHLSREGMEHDVEHDVGRDVGRSYHLTSFGVLGWAMLGSRTVLDAMNVALRYLDLSFTFALPRADVVGDQVRITVDGSTLPADVRTFLVSRDLAAIRTALGELVPGGIATTEERPDDVASDRAVLCFGVEELDRELSRADPRLAALGDELCRDVVSRRRERSGTAQQVRVHVTQHLAAGAPLALVARDLGLSERSLRRQLVAQGTSYQALLDEVRESMATELLGAGLPVAVVAERLGYAGAASFIHAHRRWTGRTPGPRPASDHDDPSGRHRLHPGSIR